MKHRQAPVELLADAVEAIPDAVLILEADTHGSGPRIVYANLAFSAMTGLPIEWVLGMSLDGLAGRALPRDAPPGLVHALREGKTYQGRFRTRHRDGRPLMVEARLVPLTDGPERPDHFMMIQRDVTRERAHRAQLRHLATHDPLTGLPNRTLLRDELSEALWCARQRGEQVGLLFMDLDRFKVINDTLGHVVGDQVLQEVARLLRGTVRRSDIVARMSGDEFVIVLPALRDTEPGEICAEKILERFSEPIEVSGQEIRLSTSIGIAFFPMHGESPDALVHHADMAMYRAKDAGRSTWRVYAQTDQGPRGLDTLRSQLLAAIERDELELYWQPIFDLPTGTMIGAEALVRWHHPTRGLLPPSRFLPIVQDLPAAGLLANRFLARACQQAAAWQRFNPFFVTTVNLWAWQLGRSDLVEMLALALSRSGLSPRNLELDISEHLLAAHPDAVHELKDLGARVCVDDFQLRHLPLHQLDELPLDAVKLDAGCLEQLRRRCASWVVALSRTGEALGLDLAAKGIAEPEHVPLLADLGIERVQGYLFAPPTKAKAFQDEPHEGRRSTPAFF